MMKAFSLNLNGNVFTETEEIRKKLDLSRNDYISQAITFYNVHQKRRLLTIKMERESRLAAENSMEVLREFEPLEDGATKD